MDERRSSNYISYEKELMSFVCMPKKSDEALRMEINVTPELSCQCSEESDVYK